MLDGGALLADVEPSGVVVVNTAAPPHVALPPGVKLVAVDAAGIALRTGLGAIVSTVLLGAFARATGLVSLEDLQAAVAEGSPARTRENLDACSAGYHAAAEPAAVSA